MAKQLRQNLHGRDTLTAREFRQMQEERTKASNSKYGNVWTIVDGINFQSKAEAKYYGLLKMRKLAGQIKGFRRQVTFTFVLNGVFLASYRADFVVDEMDGTQTVIDVKGEATEKLETFGMKKNLMKALFNIDVKVAK